MHNRWFPTNWNFSRPPYYVEVINLIKENVFFKIFHGLICDAILVGSPFFWHTWSTCWSSARQNCSSATAGRESVQSGEHRCDIRGVEIFVIGRTIYPVRWLTEADRDRWDAKAMLATRGCAAVWGQISDLMVYQEVGVRTFFMRSTAATKQASGEACDPGKGHRILGRLWNNIQYVFEGPAVCDFVQRKGSGIQGQSLRPKCERPSC